MLKVINNLVIIHKFTIKKNHRMHIALIPDGNRRYMKKEDINLFTSYKYGINKFYDFLDWCAEMKVDEVTIYALSLENIKNRESEEIEVLLDVFSEEVKNSLKDERLHKNKIKIKICGEVEELKRKDLIDNLKKLEESTSKYNNLKVNLAMAYGGRQELVRIIKEFKEDKEDFVEVNEENIRKKMWVQDYPDMIIRTGEHRISNFLLWQIAYSEIYFFDKLWGEFEKEDLINIINDYKKTNKKFGK